MVSTIQRRMTSWQRHWWLVGLAVLLGLITVELAMSRQVNGAYGAAAVVTGLLAGTRCTALVAALAVVASVGSGVWNDNLGSSEWALRLLVCCALCWVAVVSAQVNQQHRTSLERNIELARGVLHALAVEVTGARTVREVADGFATHAVTALGATSAMVTTLDADDVLRTVAWHGRGSAAADHYQEVALTSPVPGALAVRERVDLHYRSVSEIETAFADLTGYYPSDRSLHMLPLFDDTGTYGALALTFLAGTFTPSEDKLLRAVADALTGSIRRALELQAADAAAQRVALLAEAPLTLSRSLDMHATLEEVGRLLVPRHADWCAVQLLRDGELETVGVRHRDAETSRWAASMRGAFPTQMDRDSGSPQVVRTGRSELYPFIAADMLEAAAVDEEHLAILRRLGFTSAVIAPMRGRDGVTGALTLIHAESGRRYTDADVEFLEAIAERVAFALDTAATFEKQSERLAGVTLVADAAQRAILAPPPPHLGPLHLSARYHSAAAEAKVGGDLYEVVAGHGVTRLLVGDVRGKGLKAVRTATVVLGEFRAAAVEAHDVAALARQIDRRIVPYLTDDEEFVTGVFVDVHDDGRIDVVCCGHPPPMVLRTDGRTKVLVLDHARPLGLGADPVIHSARLTAGDRLLLYTDGLIEARGHDGTFIDPAPHVERAATAAFSDALDLLLASLSEATGHHLDDDLALLLTCFDPHDALR